MHIRHAEPSEYHLLTALEANAAVLFNSIPVLADLAAGPPLHTERIHTLQNLPGGIVLAAFTSPSSPEPIGFVIARNFDNSLFIHEIDVHPAFQGQGVGAALLEAICAEAKRVGKPSVSLTTYEKVPWNGVYYARRGWKVIDAQELGKEHEEQIRKERGPTQYGGEGLEREGWTRCCMVQYLGSVDNIE